MADLENPTDLGDEALVARLAELKETLFKMRFQHATGQFENTAKLRATKRDIARVHTELRAREIAAAEALNEEIA